MLLSVLIIMQLLKLKMVHIQFQSGGTTLLYTIGGY